MEQWLAVVSQLVSLTIVSGMFLIIFGAMYSDCVF